jgi:hypothetical protein
MEPACHALGHCVQGKSVVEKMKSITKGSDRISSQHTILSTEPRRYIDFNLPTLLFTKRYPLVILFIFSLKYSSLKSGLSLTFGRMTLDELYQSTEKECDDIPDVLYCPLDDDVFDEQSCTLPVKKEGIKSITRFKFEKI